jgi:RNA polymerase sigma factor (sigma-70 family)
MTVVQDEPLPGEFDRLYREQWRPMVRLAAGLVDGAAAEDIVQDAFTALHRRLAALRNPDAAAGYLRTSVVNAARSVLRRRQTARKHLRALHDIDAEPADAELMLSDDHRAVRLALAALPDRQREVLTLRYLTDCTDEQIAAALGLSRVGVRSASSRGLASLRTTLGAQL